QFFGREIGKLLSGENIGQSADTVDPKSMALWYAIDRRSDYDRTREHWAAADFVLLNRSTLSRMGCQSLRSDDPAHIVNWTTKLEFGVLRTPRPGVLLIFHVSPTISALNIK